MLASSENKSAGSRGKKSSNTSKMAFKENPREEGEEVVILLDEMKAFDSQSEIIFDQHKFHKYNQGAGFSLVFWIYFQDLPRSNSNALKNNSGKATKWQYFLHSALCEK